MHRHRIAPLICLVFTSHAACLADTSREGQPGDTRQSADSTETAQDTNTSALHQVPFRIRTLSALTSASTRICYDAQVFQGDGATAMTWSRGDPTTTARGADQSGPLASRKPTRAPDSEALCAEGGGISWTATCDPREDADPTRPGAQAALRVTFDDIVSDDADQIVAPCLEGCTVVFDCEPREAPLTLDLALVLNTGRGFSDPAGTFSDLWCQASRASCELFLKDDSGERVGTTIVGFSCGAWSEGAQLALGPVAVVCDGHSFELEPTAPGDAFVQDGGFRLRYATFFGREATPRYDDQTFTVHYYNLAIQTDDLTRLGSCRLEWSATGQHQGDDLFRGAEPTADALIYPFYTLDIELTRNGAAVCDANISEGRDHLRPELFGNVPEAAPLPARCFELSGERPKKTGHPGCD